jgi:hypothetical protein
MNNFVNLYETPIQKYHLELVIFASDEKKIFPKKGEILTGDNVNSGSCYPKKIINIWRKEELIKVLIHELIHFYGIDFHDSTQNYQKLSDVVNNIKLDDNCDSIDSCNESYTETLALIINTYIISKLIKHDFFELLTYEIYFTSAQVIKIIQHHNGNNIRDIFRIKFKQLTSVRSYFIIKFMLLLHIESFLQMVDEHKLKIGSNLIEYANYVYNVMTQRKYILVSDNTIKNFNNFDKDNKSLKMTLFDLFEL